MTKIYKHENGYSAMLYSKSSMSIFYDTTEILHTDFRNVETDKEIMKLLSDIPKLNIVRYPD